MKPTASQGLILTGYSADSSYVPATLSGWDLQIAALNKPDRVGHEMTLSFFDLYADILVWCRK